VTISIELVSGTLVWDDRTDVQASFAKLNWQVALRGTGQLYSSNKALKGAIVLDAGHELYISRRLPPDKPDQFPSVMRELTQEFSNLWTKVGGLEKFLRA
jgi:hypothetical protein